jgi:S1-C subfamily serine protease
LAEQAGIRQGTEPVRYGADVIYLGGDIITKVDGVKINRLADLYSALEDNKGGDKVPVEINRSGKTITLEVTLADRDSILSSE